MRQDVSNNRSIQINGAKVDVTVENGQTFGEFIDSVNEQISKENLVITRFAIDGKEFNQTEQDAIMNETIENIGPIEFFTSSPADLAYETLNTLEQYIDRLVASIDRAALHYREMNIMAAESYLVKAIDGLDLFVQTISGVKMALKVGLNQKVAIAEAELISTMSEILNAKKQNNYVLLADLLNKDLISNMNEWKQVVFPFFRNWRTA